MRGTGPRATVPGQEKKREGQALALRFADTQKKRGLEISADFG